MLLFLPHYNALRVDARRWRDVDRDSIGTNSSFEPHYATARYGEH
jgi:hypothetical protein